MSERFGIKETHRIADNLLAGKQMSMECKIAQNTGE